VDALAVLLENGASPLVTDNKFQTPLASAQEAHQTKAVNFLLDATANPVEVDAAKMSVIQSLGTDLVFYTSKARPLTRLSEITDGSTEFAAAELSPRMMRMRSLLGGSPGVGGSANQSTAGGFSGTGVQFGAGGAMTPLGVTYESGAEGTLMGIGEDAAANVFTHHPALRLFVAIRGSSETATIEGAGDAVRVRFVEPK
jgi:hypothetical protein